MAQQPTGNSTGLGTVVAVSAVTSAIVSAAILLGVQSGLTLFADPVPIPDLTGMSTTGAGAVLRERGLVLTVAGETYASDVEAGSVARQEPLAGSHVEPGAAVRVRISLGPEPIQVPPLEGRPLAEARSILEQEGLGVGEVTIEEGPGAADSVVRSSPAAGELVTRGSSVALVARPATIMAAVPDVTGKSVRRASEAIEEAGFVVGEQGSTFNDLRPPGIVLSQEPEAGAEAEVGSAVDIVVNR